MYRCSQSERVIKNFLCTISFSLIFILTLQSEYYYYPHFTDEKTKAGEAKKLDFGLMPILINGSPKRNLRQSIQNPHLP